MSYPLKFREHVFKTKEEENLSYVETSKRFKVELRTLMRWALRIEPKRTRNKPAVKIKMEALEEDIKKYPDAYQRERASRLGVSQHCIYQALKRLRVTYKKILSTPESEPCFQRGLQEKNESLQSSG